MELDAALDLVRFCNPRLDKTGESRNPICSLAASVAQLVEQLTLNFGRHFIPLCHTLSSLANTGFLETRFALTFAQFVSKKPTGDTIRDTTAALCLPSKYSA
jgi:hypothetical protein